MAEQREKSTGFLESVSKYLEKLSMEDIDIAFFIFQVPRGHLKSQEHMENLTLGKTKSPVMNYAQMRGDCGIT